MTSNSSRKRLSLAATILVVFLFFWFWRSGTNKAIDVQSSAEIRKDVRASYKTSGASPLPNSIANPTITSSDRAIILANALGTPIDFYGIVIDQNGDPVPGAKITYSIRSEFTVSDPKQLDAAPSEKNGRFSISGKHGASIFVNVAHPDYYRTETSKKTFTFYQDPDQIPHDKLPTANDPAVFHLIKRGNSEPLVRSRSGSIVIPLDGSPTDLGFRSGLPIWASDLGFRSGHVKKTSSGDVRVECSAHFSTSSSANDAFSWKCKISVPGGGLILRSNQWSFVAPEDGYSEADTVDMSKSDDPQWKDRASRNYFVRLSDGKYARCTIDVIPNGSHYVVLDAYYNPSGSRNLEFDPAQQIKTP